MVPGGAPQMAFPGQLLVVGLYVCVCLYGGWGGCLFSVEEAICPSVSSGRPEPTGRQRGGYLKMGRIEDKTRGGAESCGRGWVKEAGEGMKINKTGGQEEDKWGVEEVQHLSGERRNTEWSCKQVTRRKRDANEIKISGPADDEVCTRWGTCKAEEAEDEQRGWDGGGCGGLVPSPSLLRHWKVLICQSKHQNAGRPILYVPANDAEARRRLREQPEDSHFSKRYLRRWKLWEICPVVCGTTAELIKIISLCCG